MVLHQPLFVFEAVCKPPCANGGACVAPNYCACTARWGGPRCESGRLLCMKEFRASWLQRCCHPTLIQLLVNLAVRIVEYVSIIHVTVLLVGQETAVGKVCVFYACVCMYI